MAIQQYVIIVRVLPLFTSSPVLVDDVPFIWLPESVWGFFFFKKAVFPCCWEVAWDNIWRYTNKVELNCFIKLVSFSCLDNPWRWVLHSAEFCSWHHIFTFILKRVAFVRKINYFSYFIYLFMLLFLFLFFLFYFYYFLHFFFSPSRLPSFLFVPHIDVQFTPQQEPEEQVWYIT